MSNSDKEKRKEILQHLVSVQLANSAMIGLADPFSKQQAKVMVENAKTVLDVMIEQNIV